MSVSSLQSVQPTHNLIFLTWSYTLTHLLYFEWSYFSSSLLVCSTLNHASQLLSNQFTMVMKYFQHTKGFSIWCFELSEIRTWVSLECLLKENSSCLTFTIIGEKSCGSNWAQVISICSDKLCNVSWMYHNITSSRCHSCLKLARLTLCWIKLSTQSWPWSGFWCACHKRKFWDCDEFDAHVACSF